MSILTDDEVEAIRERSKKSRFDVEGVVTAETDRIKLLAALDEVRADRDQLLVGAKAGDESSRSAVLMLQGIMAMAKMTVYIRWRDRKIKDPEYVQLVPYRSDISENSMHAEGYFAHLSGPYTSKYEAWSRLEVSIDKAVEDHRDEWEKEMEEGGDANASEQEDQ